MKTPLLRLASVFDKLNGEAGRLPTGHLPYNPRQEESIFVVFFTLGASYLVGDLGLALDIYLTNLTMLVSNAKPWKCKDRHHTEKLQMAQ